MRCLRRIGGFYEPLIVWSVNKEVKHRTRVATQFPSETSCLRLVSAVLMEMSDDCFHIPVKWKAGKAYLTLSEKHASELYQLFAGHSLAAHDTPHHAYLTMLLPHEVRVNLRIQ